VKGSDANKAKALVKGKGAGLPDPALPLALPVTAQLFNGESGICWGASYDAPDLKKSTGELFKAKAQ
jgi:hypothetical protein